MALIQNTVHYCCVSRSNRVLYAYNGGDQEIENLATLCLEITPPFHKWYFETVRKKTYGFLVEDGYVYFTIVDQGFGNRGLLQFLEHLRDEFKKVAKKKGLRGNFSSKSSAHLQEKLVPVVRRLINSLEHVSDERVLSPSPINMNGIEVTKAPLLGKSGKLEKKKTKDHVICVRDSESEENRKSTDRGTKFDPSNQGGEISVQKDLGLMRMRSSGSLNLQKKWWRLVRIVLAIDAAHLLAHFEAEIYGHSGLSSTTRGYNLDDTNTIRRARNNFLVTAFQQTKSNL
ncbi:hypothetical protein ACFE04_025488 [Oxalis oulophora]